MANLTGEYDVATEVGLGLVNCILAAIHENENEAYPTLLHSLKVRVDDRYRGAEDPVPESERTASGRWPRSRCPPQPSHFPWKVWRIRSGPGAGRR
jgi:hypothetical protein